MLPSDLRQAEAQLLKALHAALKSKPSGRWTIELRFEGLKLLPLSLRLGAALESEWGDFRMVYPDAGAMALAKRDQAPLAASITSLGDRLRLQENVQAKETEGPRNGESPLLVVVGPGPSDYDLVERVCANHQGSVVLLNPTLEDAAVGIGSVARARRKGFLAQWHVAYALQPFPNSALRRAYPGEWELYRLDPDGFRLAGQFPQKPSSEDQAAALGENTGGLKQQLRGLGDLIDNLQQ